MSEFLFFLRFMGAVYGLSIGGIALFAHYQYHVEFRLLWLAWFALAVGICCVGLIFRYERS